MVRAALIVVALLLAGCAAVPARPPAPSPQDIVALAKAGAPAQDIIRRMQESGAVYALPASALAKLHDQGVPDAVIDYMNQTYLSAVRRQEALRQYQREMLYSWPYGYYGGPFGPGWPPWW